MNYTRLKELYKADGEKRFATNMINNIHEGKLNADNFSLKGMWEVMGSPDFARDKRINDMRITEAEFQEATGSSLFPKVTGALISKVVQEAYKLEYGIGMQLVTKIPATQLDETIVGFADDDVMLEVPELMPYQEGTVVEKYHKIKNRKWGRLISLSEEMVKFDQTGQIVSRARRIGEMAKAKQEYIIIGAVVGLPASGSYAAWRPAGSAVTLYSATSTDPYSTAAGTLNNLGTNILVDETDLDIATVAMATYTDEKGNIMAVTPKILLTAQGLLGIARRITRTQGVTAATFPEKIYDVYAQELGIKHLYSPLIDSRRGATYWYYGDPKKQFVYTEVFPLQTFQAKKGSEDEFKRDVLFQFKSRFMGGCGAVTNRYVFGSTGNA